LRSVFLLIGTFVLWAVAREYQVRAAFSALDEAGYGERVIEAQPWHSHCASDQTTFTFIAQGGKRAKPSGLENTGYVCVGYFGKSSVHEVPIRTDELPDWE
jgi:hypothetical protein